MPTGVTTAQFTALGGSGGGGGGADLTFFPHIIHNGGKGGNSGKAVTILAVTPAQVYDVVVGSAGAAGSNYAGPSPSAATDGGTGTITTVKLATTTYCRGDNGTGGTHATGIDGLDGTDGSGLGDAVSVGGGEAGGSKGIGGGAAPSSGHDGLVEVRW